MIRFTAFCFHESNEYVPISPKSRHFREGVLGDSFWHFLTSRVEPAGLVFFQKLFVSSLYSKFFLSPFFCLAELKKNRKKKCVFWRKILYGLRRAESGEEG